MKNRITKTALGISCILFFAFQVSAADIVSQGTDGEWNNPGTWNLGRLPQCGDNIIIPKNSKVLVSSMVNLSNGATCANTKLNIFGILAFESGKKINFFQGAKVLVLSTGEIQPSEKGAGSSEQIEIGKSIFWKASNGILKGKFDESSYLNVDMNEQAEKELERNKQMFRMPDAKAGGTFTGIFGTRIIIKENSLLNRSGAVLEGPADIELIEIYNRSEMILNNKPTLGFNAEGLLSPLTSGGEYFLRITQNGQEVGIREGIEIRMKAIRPVEGMDVFEGKINGNGLLTWYSTKTSPKIVTEKYDGQSVPAYAFTDQSWGWTNIDKFMDDPREKGHILVKLPPEFNGHNTSVFVTFKGEKNSVAKLDQFNEDGFFTEHYGYMPVGMTITIIALSRDGDLWITSKMDVVVSQDMKIFMNTFSPETQADLVQFLNSMP